MTAYARNATGTLSRMNSMQPIAKTIFVCDEVVADPVSGKVSVLNLLNTVRIPPGESLPYRLAKLSVFAEFREGHGEATIRVLFRRADTGEIFAQTSERTVLFSHPRETIYFHFRVSDLKLPDSGVFFVEVFCNNQFVDDQVVAIMESGEEA